MFISIHQQFGANSIFLRNHKLLAKNGADEPETEGTIRKYQVHHGATSYKDKCIKKKKIKITRNQYFHEQMKYQSVYRFFLIHNKTMENSTYCHAYLQWESKPHKIKAIHYFISFVKIM